LSLFQFGVIVERALTDIDQQFLFISFEWCIF